jgi:DNA polymerase
VSLDKAALRELNLYPRWVRREMPAPAEVVAPAVEQPVADISAPVVTSPSIPAQPAQTTPQSSPCPDLGWDALRSRVKDCTACRLRAGCTQTVFGVGDPQADWLFVGEGPGADEDIKGEPFVGQAGKLLDNMLAAIKLKRGDNVFIANVVKCRPPGNRTPEPDEVAQCMPYLRRQIELIQPRIIVALGKTAATALLDRDASLASLRGRLHDYHGIPLVIAYHPAYLLRSPTEKAKAWQDLCLAVETYQKNKGE